LVDKENARTRTAGDAAFGRAICVVAAIEAQAMNPIDERLDRIERMLAVLVEREQVRDWYTTQEFAESVGKAEFTIREYCRLGRLHAEKRQSGRGAYPQWVISHAELERYRRSGLLPIQRPA
jgi:hypothetical protein